MQLTDSEWEFIKPYLPVGEYGPYPERLRQQFEGVIWRFRTGGQWREMPAQFGAWSTVHNRFRQWRDARVFEALLEGLIAEAAKRGEVDRPCPWSASTPPPSGPTTTRPGCTWTRMSHLFGEGRHGG
ncbi:transposase [Streptomyces sp. DG2A-72]|nr:transposase [Streptomyces sp. DG2A-72]MDO0930320.1 transposase [Streptomyces sp. DG2A-72]